MKFIHTADIHLDSPLVGLAAYQDAPAELLRTATRDAFTRLVDAALAESVDFMVIAGDLYDGGWKDFNTGLFFLREMGRLNKAGIQVYLLYGNHDAESEMTRKLVLPDNVHLFGSRAAQTHRIDALKVALHGRSFKEAATTDNLAVNYPTYVAGYFNIGVLHTALEGNAAHANYAPCSIAELEAKGYEYWALGHVHEHRVWRGRSAVVFPGNLQGRHIREAGPRGAVLVTTDGNEIRAIERLLVDVLRWHAVGVDVSGASSLPDVLALVNHALVEAVADVAEATPLAVRVTLHGATPAHGELFGLESQLRAEVLGLAAGIGGDRIWIEKVRIKTQPLQTAAMLAARSDALADLQSLLVQAGSDPAFLASLSAEFQPLVGKLQLDVLQAMPELKAIRAGDFSEVLDEVGPGLIAHLASVGGKPS